MAAVFFVCLFFVFKKKALCTLLISKHCMTGYEVSGIVNETIAVYAPVVPRGREEIKGQNLPAGRGHGDGVTRCGVMVMG